MNLYESTQSLRSSFGTAEMVYASPTENGLSKRYCGSKT